MTATEYQELLHLAGTVFVHWAALVGLASVIVHLRVFDRHSRMSMHLMFYMIMIDAVLILSCVVNDIGDSPWFQALRLAVFIGVPVAMTQRLFIQVSAQRAAPGTAALQPDGKPDSPDDREGQRTD